MFSIHDTAAVDAWRAGEKLDPNYLRRLRNVFYKKQGTAEAALAELPEQARRSLASELAFHSLELVSRHDSQRDGATKLIFRTAGGLLLESVVLRMTTGRTALCVSTQVGCAANCAFCATGKMGIARDLTSAEILDQLIQANQLLAVEGRSVRNLVFMGMGEPFHNEQRLYAALDVLADAGAFHLNLKRVLISSVGIPDAMVRCVRRYPDVRMALSLHSARAEVRREIMPISQRYTLEELREGIDEISAVTGHLVMIEYLLLADVNDTDDDAKALIEYLRGAAVHINLIPYNPIAESSELRPSSPERQQEFARILKTAGFPVTTRYSLGSDIEAACGQLVRQEHRRRTQVRERLSPLERLG